MKPGDKIELINMDTFTDENDECINWIEKEKYTISGITPKLGDIFIVRSYSLELAPYPVLKFEDGYYWHPAKRFKLVQ